MQALILSDTPDTQLMLSRILAKRGFQVAQCESVMMATAHVRACIFDLLVMEERVHDQLTHGVALSAERRAPFVKTVLLSDRKGEDVDDLYDLLPSLVSIVSPSLSPDLIGQFALASVTGGARMLETASEEQAALPAFSSRRTAQALAMAG